MNSIFRKSFLFILVSLSFLFPFFSFAQAPEEIYQAKVTSVLSEEMVPVPGTNIVANIQTIEARVLEGEYEGSVITFENDYIELRTGDRFFLGYMEDESGAVSYRVVERNRIPILAFFVGLFIVVILAFGKKQGLRSLLSLAGSLFILAYVLIPSLLRGVNPVLASVVVATIILFIAIYFTHGFKRESTAAFLGTIIAVVCTGVLSVIAVAVCRFTGLSSDEAALLNVHSSEALNFSGLLLGGIMIGVLGVLDDIAVTQVSIVRELYSSASHLTKKEIYSRALRVGQEHVGALVNTLALAYAGVSLPLLLIFSTSAYSLSVVVSQELFSVEIIRTIVGSIGLVLTVPITTFLAVYMLERYRGKEHDHSLHVHHH